MWLVGPVATAGTEGFPTLLCFSPWMELTLTLALAHRKYTDGMTAL